MKLSVRGEYALRALVILGWDYGKKDVIPIQSISEQQNIPRRFLEQILNDLRGAGILESKRGVNGGYKLRMPPGKITLAEVIRYIEGPLAPVGCVSENFYEPCTCPNEEKCGIRSVMKEVHTAIVQVLGSVTVADLCERTRMLQAERSPGLDFVI